MKDSRLVNLNFHQLLNYGGQPSVKHRYPSAIKCSGYCIDCEQKGLAHGNCPSLDQMSHGCDTSDFEAVLGPMPTHSDPVDAPVMFLMDRPGGDKGNGMIVHYKGISKRPPVFHYYWTPKVTKWPRGVRDFAGSFSGPYFAYLMLQHGLRNVYLTNIVKCSWKTAVDSATDKAVEMNCASQWFRQELATFSPRVVFCFGGDVEKCFRRLVKRGSDMIVTRLLHHAYIANRWQTRHKSQEEAIQQNDQTIRSIIAQL